MNKLPGNAIVIGASIGGLSAARVLADHFERVTLIERDVLEDGPRQGAPQAHHIHVLLRRGVDLLDQYFPGLLDEMKAAGIEPFDFTKDLRWLQFGDWMPREPSGIVLYPQTRASLERALRRRVRAFANVEILESTAVRALLATPDGRRILGVQTVDRQSAGGAVTNRLASVVVDASGRGSQLGKWLADLGHGPLEESRLPINLCYVSRLFERPATARDWRGLWVTPLPPEAPRGGAMQEVEGNRWIVSLFGYGEHHPSREESGFVEFARSLREPDIYEAIKDARPASDVHVYRVPDVRWRHFERLRDFPAGLLVLGDAWCYFDPVFGQGMSVAMLEANVLNEALHQLDSLEAVTQAWTADYLRMGSQWLRGLWFFVSAEAMRHVHVPGERTRLVKLAQWYVEELYALNHAHPEVYREFLKLMHVQAGPEFLLRPDIAVRLAKRAWRKKTAPSAKEPVREGVLWPASRVALGLRYAGRVLANLAAPEKVGPRDRLCHFDTEAMWQPDKSMGWFVRDALKSQNLLGEAGEVRKFLEFWLPFQGLGAAKKALIELSFNVEEPGLGFMLYSDNQTVTRAFREYTRRLGISNEGVERSVAICETFRPSDLGMVRAEFKPGSTTRYSIASSWHFDPLRGHTGFEEAMARLPERFRVGMLAERVKAHASALANEYFPLFLGLSFQEDGTVESKMYLVRFDDKRPPFQPGSELWRFLQGMGVSDSELERIKQLNDLLWERSADKMTQIAIEASELQSQPKRVNFIFSGTQTSAVLEAIARFGYPPSAARAVRDFERMMQTDYAKFVAIRVGPKGLSPRIKLYKHALFDFSDLSVVEDGGLTPRNSQTTGSGPEAARDEPGLCLY